MPKRDAITRRITIAKAIKIDLARILRDGTLELEKASELSSSIATRLKKAESIEVLNLEFSKIVKEYPILTGLPYKLEEIEKFDLDHEIADLVEGLIRQGEAEKAIKLGQQVLSVYIQNPNINLDDFRRELLQKWQGLTKKVELKKHPTLADRDAAASSQAKDSTPAEPVKILHPHSHPVIEGQILQEGEEFQEASKDHYQEPGEELKGPSIDALKLQEKSQKLQKNLSSFAKLFKEASAEVTSETMRKLKDSAVNVLAKGQEKIEQITKRKDSSV
jgi:hypothetical protein